MNEKKRLRKLRRLERQLGWSHWMIKDGRVSAALKYGFIHTVVYATFYQLLDAAFDRLSQPLWSVFVVWALTIVVGMLAMLLLSKWLYPRWLDGYERMKLKIEELKSPMSEIDILKAEEQLNG